MARNVKERSFGMVWRSCLLSAAVAVATMPAMMASKVVAGQAPEPGQATFAKDIAPILQRSCQNCHHPGGGAPMSLLTFDEVRPWARSIKSRTEKREMPPWYIEKDLGIQHFKDDPSLSNEEIAKIGQWADAGAARGNPADMPPPLKFAEGKAWNMGTPDLIVSAPVVDDPALSPDWEGELPGRTAVPLTEDRYVMAAEFKEVWVEEGKLEVPSEGRADLVGGAVHHLQIAVSRKPLSDDDPSGGITSEPGVFSWVYELGQNAVAVPNDTGEVLPAHSSIKWTLHRHSIGKPLKVRVDIAFKFYPKDFKPKYRYGNVFYSGPLNFHELDIPGGARDVKFEVFGATRQAARMVDFEPHMHASGVRMCVEAIYPNSRREMLSCAAYNHNWVRAYYYDEQWAPLLPAGTILRVTGWWNNSAANRRDAEPRNWKGVGNRSIDDMFWLLSKFVPLTEAQYNEEVAKRTQLGRTPIPAIGVPTPRVATASATSSSGQPRR
jgi:hypothetical protein